MFVSKIKNFLQNYWNVIVLVGVPLICLPFAVSQYKALQCTYILCIVAVFWVTEVLNLAVTSFIPLLLFPAFGILTPSEVSSCYMKDITMMLIGGIIVAMTIEEQNLHTRLALRILMIMGPNPIFQYLGFMLSSWFLSMWISNTATTAMMVTLGAAVMQQWKLIIEGTHKERDSQAMEMDNIPHRDGDKYDRDEDLRQMEIFTKGLYLSIAYSSTCGGIATLTGTAPNLIFYGFIIERYGDKFNLNFGNFMLFALPISIIALFMTWTILCLRYIGLKKIFKRKRNKEKDEKKINSIRKQYQGLGPLKYGEISVFLIFTMLVLLWILREPGIPLWGRLFMYSNRSGVKIKYWSDTTSAVLATLLVFIMPSKNPFRRSNTREPIPKLLDWKKVEKDFPWGLVFLFGGGFALAAGCEKSGLSDIIGKTLTNLSNLPEIVIIFLITLSISFLTEVTSNSATSTVLIPIMFKMAECMKMHPMKLALAACIASSFSFCLPAATPPNAIVFSTGKLRVIDMASSGFCLNFLCVFLLTIMICYYSTPIFQTNNFPTWITANCSGP